MKTALLPAVALFALAACRNDAPAEGAAPGEVLEGSISDEMLPVDSVRSEPPLEDPEAFREVLEEAASDPSGAVAVESGEAAAEGAEQEGDASEPTDDEPAPAAED